MRPTALALAASLALPFSAAAKDRESHHDCTVEVGPGERFEQDRNAEVRAGEHVRKVVALHGDVILHAGAAVDQAVALGGSVVLERGARVHRDAVAIGGGVRLGEDARVEESAVAIGGTVTLGEGAQVDGKKTSIDVALDGRSLGAAIRERIGAVEACKKITVVGRSTSPGDGGSDLDDWDPDPDL